MEQHISLREANQHFSRYIEAVQKGQQIVITRRGVPVAKLVGVSATRELSPEQEEARAQPRAHAARVCAGRASSDTGRTACKISDSPSTRTF